MQGFHRKGEMTTTNSITDDYCALVEEVRTAGLMTPRPWFYAVKMSLTIVALAAGWVAFSLVGDSWNTLGIAVVLAVAFTQVVFFGHDAGHQQIFASRRVNRLVGLVVANGLTGLSFGWWVPKHNAHHAFPNQCFDRDPDIGAGAIALTFTAALAERRHGLGRQFVRWQARPVLSSSCSLRVSRASHLQHPSHRPQARTAVLSSRVRSWS